MKRYPPFILQRMILGELSLNLFFSLAVITSVFFIGMVIQSVYRYSELPMSTILTVIPFFLPRALTFTIPITALIAAVQTYGRLSSDNEITAIRVGGIHLYHIVAPAIFLGIALSTVSYQLNASLVPKCIERWKHITRSSFDEVLTSMRTGDHEIRVSQGQMSLTANADGTFSNILFVRPDDEGEGDLKVVARRGQVTIDRDNEKLVLSLEDGVLTREGVVFPFATKDFGFSLAEQQAKVRLPHKEATLEELYYRLGREDLERLHPLFRTEIHKRIALSFASIVFVILGAPLGVLFRRGGRMTALFLGFLLVIVVYYPLILLGEAVSSDGRIPASLGMWIGNALVSGVGITLLVRVFRE